jgi:hypothetical protein
MREGNQAEEAKKEEQRRRRASEEVIDEEEAPQVVIQDEDKEQINEQEARKYVAEKAGVKVDSTKDDASKPPKPKEENVSLGMRKTKKPKEGLKRQVEDDDDKSEDTSGKTKKSTLQKQKGKKLKLSFDEDD